MSQAIEPFTYEDAAELAEAMAAVGATWSPTDATHHGEFGESIYPGRQVLDLPGIVWPHTPDECTHADLPGRWVLDGQILICDGCGIDCT